MKKYVILIVCIICSVCFALTCRADVPLITKAQIMYNLGLIRGTGTGFSAEELELERDAKRVEQATMIIRMLGKEEKAAYQQNPHPFSDVPQWASDNIGWLYENYIINGETETYFGSEHTATVQQFCAMLLRVLGYDDSAGDFNYDEAVGFAQYIGLADAAIAANYELSRSDMFELCYNALGLNINNSRRTLIEKLCDEGSIAKALAKNSGLLSENTLSDAFPGVPQNLGNINVMTSYNLFKIKFTQDIEEFGVRVFVQEAGSTVIKEITEKGDVHLKKGRINYKYGGSAGYISELTVYGLDTGKDYEFIIIKTSSEDDVYQIMGKSNTAYN